MNEGEVNSALIQLVQEQIPEAFVGKVLSVDEATAEVEVLYNELEYTAKLKSIVDEQEVGLMLLPEVDSMVYVVPEGIVEPRYVVAKVNTIAKVKLVMGDLAIILDKEKKLVSLTVSNTTIEVMEDLARINGGDNGGVPVSESITAKLNALEDDINSLKQAFSQWVPVSQDGGAALKSGITSWAGQSIANTQSGDLENTKFKH
jgi:hypothetical protein